LHSYYGTDTIGLDGDRRPHRYQGGNMNKRKKVAWHKHLAKARKAKAKRKANR